ncbi:hypothetical protein AMTRI_Chr06g194090 [Amborella trichopoda]
MKSSMSLCTGVTYTRSSIQKWLDNGNNTCPATDQSPSNKKYNRIFAEATVNLHCLSSGPQNGCPMLYYLAVEH